MKIIEIREPRIGKAVTRATVDYLDKNQGELHSVDYENFIELEYDLFSKLEKLGWRSLGNGHFSMVFFNARKPYILKVNMVSDPGYTAFAKMAKQYPNKYFPKISDLKELKSNGREYGIYLIEKLVKMEIERANIYAEILRSVLKGEKGQLTLNNTDAHRLGYSQSQWEHIMEEIFGDPEFVSAINMIVAGVKSRRFQVDMHQNNIMQRADGTPVIIDPYATLATEYSPMYTSEDNPSDNPSDKSSAYYRSL